MQTGTKEWQRDLPYLHFPFPAKPNLSKLPMKPALVNSIQIALNSMDSFINNAMQQCNDSVAI